jgi:hypothetical protein
VGSSPTPTVGATTSPGYLQGGSLNGIQYNNNVGLVSNVSVYENWIRGGRIGINMGSVTRTSGQILGTTYRNRFTRDQGLQSTGGDSTYTINIDTSFSDSSGIAASDCGEGTSDANYYLDNGDEVLVRRNG